MSQIKHIDIPDQLWVSIKKNRKNINGKDESISQVIHRWGVKAGAIKND